MIDLLERMRKRLGKKNFVNTFETEMLTSWNAYIFQRKIANVSNKSIQRKIKTLKRFKGKVILDGAKFI